MKLLIKDISFNYESRTVLDDITFDLSSSHILALLGVNGAGKSTLLKCIDKILTPVKGAVYIDDFNVHTLHGEVFAHKVGYMPQRNEDSVVTVYDMILLGRKPYFKWEPSQNDYDVVEKYIKTMSLSDLAFRPMSSLSGGEAQKVILARAFAQEPDFILLDEPTNSLDIKNQLEVMGLIRHIAKDHGQTIIVTMHDINLALRYCDKFILLHHGSIYSAGSPEIINEKNIKTVYGVDSVIKKIEGSRVVIPVDINHLHDKRGKKK